MNKINRAKFNISEVKAYAVGYSHAYYDQKKNQFYDKELSNMYHKGFIEGIVQQYVNQIDSEVDFDY